MSYATKAAAIAALVISTTAFGAETSAAPQASRESKAVPGQYIVRLKTHGASSMRASSLEKIFGGAVVDRLRDDMFLVQRDPSESAPKALSVLRANDLVASASLNEIVSIHRAPSDSEYSKLWGMNNAGGPDTNGVRGLKGVDIGAEKAWDKTTGSKDVVVAIIDTGVDFKIPDLAGNAWTNQVEAAGKAGVDDDANGYVDDIHGYNFVANKGDSTDDNGHGSHCAGTIGGRGDDGRGVAGVNWNVSIMAVKFLDDKGGGTLAGAIKAIDYARKNGAKILSNSWGGGAFNQALFDVIQDTQKAGQLFVAAAGNDGNDNDANPAYPASFKIDNIVSVAALDQRGELADFSNYGATSVNIAAPGVDIYSTVPSTIDPSGFEYMSGTSMATPHVSGAAALILADSPNLTYQELKARLYAGARPLHSLKGKVTTGGILDISYALNGGTPPLDPNDVSAWAEKSPQTVSSPHPYGDKFNQTFTVTVPGASRVAVHFPKFETESNYDVVQFFNKAGDLLGQMSGTHPGSYSPIADGDTLILKMTSDDNVNGYGFDVDAALFEKAGP